MRCGRYRFIERAARDCSSRAGRLDARCHAQVSALARFDSHWSFGRTGRRISEFGTQVFDVTDEEGWPLLWLAIRNCRFDCANTLLAYAKSEKIYVTFRTANRDLLSWAIKNDAYGRVKFILEKLAERCASIEETCDLMASHLCTIGKKCPELLVDLLKNDKLTVEYARFQVPKAAFDNDSTLPVAMTTNTMPVSWEGMGADPAKRFWIEYCKQKAGELESESDIHVVVVAKVCCISQWIPWRRQTIMGLSLPPEFCFLNAQQLHLCT